MKKTKVFLLTSFAISGLSLLGVGCDSSVGSSSATYGYSQCTNCSDGNGNCETDQSQCSAGGCTTGLHSLDSAEDYCDTLNDASANNYCMANTRAQMYQTQGCSGTFNEPTTN